MYIWPVLFPPVSNREDWFQILSLNDDDTGAAIDLSGLTFQLEIRNLQDGSTSQYNISSFYYASASPIITAALGTGLTVVDVGKLQIEILETKMRALNPGTYQVACTCTDGTKTRQLFVGRLPIIDGGVTT